jgi:hypothetical protein
MNINEAMGLLTEASVRSKDGHLISVNDSRIEISREGLAAIGKQLDKIFKKALKRTNVAGAELLPAIRVDIQLDRTREGKNLNRIRGLA